MGQRGPKKTPKATKQLRGTYRADRDDEPVQFDPRIPPVPEGLRVEVADEWNRLAPLLADKGLLTEVDWLAWRLGMSAYETWITASEKVIEQGEVVYGASGAPYQNPLVSIAKNAWQSVLKFCREFGLTPSARSGLKIQGGPLEPKDPFDEHLAGNK